MTTIQFYGRPIPANHRNVKLLMFGFYPALMLLSYVVLCLNAYALSEMSGISMWFTLPFLFALCLEFEGNSRKRYLLPQNMRRYVQQGMSLVSLYLFWKNEETVKFAIVAVYVAHMAAHKLTTWHWAKKEAAVAERTGLDQSVADLEHGQLGSDEDPKTKP